MAEEGEKDLFEETFQYESQVELKSGKILFIYLCKSILDDACS